MSTTETILLDDNSRHRIYTGAEKFHKAGYYGERVIAATGESWGLSEYNPGGLVLDPLGRGDGGYVSHPISTAAVFFQFAPKSRLVLLDMGSRQSTDPDRCYVNFARYSLPVIQELGVLCQFNSFTHSTNKTTRKMYEDAMNAVPYYCNFWSMGNDDDDEYSRITDLECMFGIGAYRIMVSGEIVPEGFSSEAETCDFAAPDMIAYNINATSPTASGHKPSGTSYSAPTAAALACLVNDFFIDKTGKPLTREALYNFFLDHCEDIGDEGFDWKMGHGAIRLPDPSEIDIEKYATYSSDTPVVDPDPEEPEEPVDEEDSMDPNNYKEYTTTKNDNVQVTIVPYANINEVGFAQCNQPTETVESWYNRQEDKPQIVTNGGLFNMSSGTNILSFIDEGKEQNYSNGFEGMGITNSNSALLKPGFDKDFGWRDFMSAYPVLVRDGKAVEEYDKGTELNYNAARTAVGVRANGDLIILTVDKPGMKFDEMANIFVENGAWFAMNMDGGGSVYKMEFDKVTNTPTEKRAVDNVFYVKLKEKTDMDENATVNLDLPEITPGIYYAAAPIEFKAGIDTDDRPSTVLDTIKVGDQVEVRLTNPWNGKMWVNVEWQYQRGYIVYDGENLTSGMPIPAIFRVTEDTDDFARSTKVVVDDVNSDDNTYQVVAIATLNSETGLWDVENITDIWFDASKLEYVGAYTGTLIPDEDPDQPQEPVTPGEGSGEGDEPENPEDPNMFPAYYKVNPDMVNSVLNVREMYPDGEVIDTLMPGEEILVLEMVDNNAWAKIQFNDQEAYVSAGYIIYSRAYEEEETPEEPEEEVDINTYYQFPKMERAYANRVNTPVYKTAEDAYERDPAKAVDYIAGGTECVDEEIDFEDTFVFKLEDGRYANRADLDYIRLIHATRDILKDCKALTDAIKSNDSTITEAAEDIRVKIYDGTYATLKKGSIAEISWYTLGLDGNTSYRANVKPSSLVFDADTSKYENQNLIGVYVAADEASTLKIVHNVNRIKIDTIMNDPNMKFRIVKLNKTSDSDDIKLEFYTDSMEYREDCWIILDPCPMLLKKSDATVVADFSDSEEPSDPDIETPIYENIEKLEDKDQIGESYKDGVEFCLENGIMVGYNNKFNPTETVDRQTLATVVYRSFCAASGVDPDDEADDTTIEVPIDTEE